jgi:hypothetical protein
MVAAGTLLVGGGSVVSACVHDDSTLFIRNVIAPPRVSAGQACTYTADPTQPILTAGTLDAALSNQYSAVFLVGNQTVPRGDPNTPKTETNRITVEGGIVNVTDVNGGSLNSFTTQAAGTIDPSSGSNPGYTSIGMTILDFGTVQKHGPSTLGSTVRFISKVRVFGHTLGGQYVESDEFPFPIDVCAGCLIQFSPADINMMVLPQPNCLNAGSMTASGGTNLPSPCVPGQDEFIDCSQCLSNPACNPAVVGGGGTVVVDAGAG